MFFVIITFQSGYQKILGNLILNVEKYHMRVKRMRMKKTDIDIGENFLKL